MDAEGRRSQRATPAHEPAPRLELLTNFPPLPSPHRHPVSPEKSKNEGICAKGTLRGVVSLSLSPSLLLSFHLSRSSATLHPSQGMKEENSMTLFFDSTELSGGIF